MMNTPVEKWLYTKNDSGKIEASQDGIIAQPPASVFKFFSKNRVCDVVKGVFYASHPYQFNDPFECTSNFISDIDPKIIERCKSIFLDLFPEMDVNKIDNVFSD